MAVGLGGTTGGDFGFGEGLIFYRGIAQIEQAADRRAVLGGKGLGLIAVADDHD